ncbi:pentatricopeptide repeat-containing protein At3g22470, mitochondrial-like [Mercurialis annua]|uniref:pentatricopeptide repeat-containing protein At3g22470, mitochondrial-like n=1 Tax=Mercurialis annua TaxID=3986 RepID=UPI0024ADE6B9|nr:pentatricopeptide repeat-containing protein At3g22470, mitochondrial-like [Mercurialis annua]
MPAHLMKCILIKLYCKNKRIDDAKQLFKDITPSIVTYTSMIHGLCQAGRLLDGRDLFNDMPCIGPSPNIATYGSLIHGFCKHGDFDAGLALFHEMENSMFKPNCEIYSSLIDGLCKAGKFKDLFNRFLIQGLQPDAQTYNILINGICREGLLDEAYQVFRKMIEDGCFPDSCTYNVIIQGFLKHNDLLGAKQLIEEMRDKGFCADATTLSLVADVLSTDDGTMRKLLDLKDKGSVELPLIVKLIVFLVIPAYQILSEEIETEPEEAALISMGTERGSTVQILGEEKAVLISGLSAQMLTPLSLGLSPSLSR